LVSSPDVVPFMVYSPVAAIVVVLLRGAASGLSAGFLYRAIAKINKTAAVLAAAAISAIVNTGLFIVGVYAFFIPVLNEWGISGAADIASFVFLGMIGMNFLFELGINLVISPAIVRLIQYRALRETRN